MNIESKAYCLYKANSPFDGQQCFADHLNANLAMKKPLGPAWTEKAEELNRLILESSLPNDVMLYRAMLDGYLAPHIVGSELFYPAFMSTTYDMAAVERHFSTPFRDCAAALLKIECHKGLPALNMEQDPAFGVHEKEFLLPMGAKFQVIGRKEIVDKAEIAQFTSWFYAGDFSMLKVYRLMYLGVA